MGKHSKGNPRLSAYIPFLRRFTDERALELAETKELYARVRRLHANSRWADSGAVSRFAADVYGWATYEVDLPTTSPLFNSVIDCLTGLLLLETTVFSFPDVDFDKALSLKDLVDLRRFLRSKEHFHDHEEKAVEALTVHLGLLVKKVVGELGPLEPHNSILAVPLVSIVSKPNDLVDYLLSLLCDQDECNQLGLFASLRDTIYKNICAISGLVPHTEHKKPFLTADKSTLPPVELVEAYLGNTPVQDLLVTPIPLPLSPTIRFEHHWIISPPGTGKSTTLQYLINRDLDLVAEGKASVIVMESNRDLIKAIEGLKRFGAGGDLEDKLITIDVEDVEWPIALNIFDVGMDRINDASPRDREALLNSATSMLDYVFRALLGAEMTSRQSTLFNFTIQLLLQIPSATLDTLIDLMQPNGLRHYDKYVAQLDYDARRFFDLKFGSKEFEQTKSQVVDRLFAIKRIRTLSRMFSAPHTKLDLFTEMGNGRVILINAAKSLLQEDGVEIFSRFFIAMILLAAEKRQLLPQSERLPTYVYLDECHDVIRRDEKIPIILDQARKFRVALILAHQRLDQLTTPVLNALLGSTAIKFAAKLSDANAAALARNMGTSPEFILKQPAYSYAAHVRGLTGEAISIKIPLVDFMKMERMSSEEQEFVRDQMRERYAFHQSELQRPEIKDTPAPQPKTSPSQKPAAKPKDPDDIDTRPSEKW